jgi:hypothetical protein
MSIEVHAIQPHSGIHVDIQYTVDGEPRTLTLEHDDAGEFLEAIAANPDATFDYARAIAEANEKEINA